MCSVLCLSCFANHVSEVRSCLCVYDSLFLFIAQGYSTIWIFTFCLSIHLPVDTSVVSILGLLWKSTPALSFFVNTCFHFSYACHAFFQNTHTIFTFPPAMCNIFVSLFNVSHVNLLSPSSLWNCIVFYHIIKDLYILCMQVFCKMHVL